MMLSVAGRNRHRRTLAIMREAQAIVDTLHAKKAAERLARKHLRFKRRYQNFLSRNGPKSL